MTDNKLPNAIAILCDMENNNYMMTRAIEDLNRRISLLGHHDDIRKPFLVKAQKAQHNTLDSLGSSFFAGGVIGVIAGIIYGIITGIIAGTSEGFGHGLGVAIGNAIVYGIALTIIGIIAGPALYLIARFAIIPFLDRKDMKKRQQKYNEDYEHNYRLYEMELSEDVSRVKKELALKQALSAERNKLIERKHQATQNLNKFYDAVNIAPQFRNIAAITCMNEFATLKISTKLDGTDGLYYLVKQEFDKLKVWNMLEGISGKIDTIVDRLDEISSKIEVLDDNIETLNYTCDRMISETIQSNALLENINSNTALSLYHQERIAKEQAYQSALLTWDFIDNRIN